MKHTRIDAVRSIEGETSEEMCEPHQAEAWRLVCLSSNGHGPASTRSFYYKTHKKAAAVEAEIKAGKKTGFDLGIGTNWLSQA